MRRQAPDPAQDAAPAPLWSSAMAGRRFKFTSQTLAPLNHTERSAFTLIETALATLIIAVGVLALVEAHQAFLSANAWATHSSTATLLAGEIRERTRTFPRHDPFAGGLYFTNPQSQTGFSGWGPEPDEITPAEFDDLDDFDGVVFGDAADADLPGPVTVVDGVPMRFDGPIDADAQIVPQTDWTGQVVTDEAGEPLPLQGWTQYVQVDKVDPLDFTTALANDYTEPASGSQPLIEVDQFPLRVTVTTLYQGPFETSAREVATITWVVAP